jgi:hypothetical protein
MLPPFGLLMRGYLGRWRTRLLRGSNVSRKAQSEERVDRGPRKLRAGSVMLQKVFRPMLSSAASLIATIHTMHYVLPGAAFPAGNPVKAQSGAAPTGLA